MSKKSFGGKHFGIFAPERRVVKLRSSQLRTTKLQPKIVYLSYKQVFLDFEGFIPNCRKWLCPWTSLEAELSPKPICPPAISESDAGVVYNGIPFPVSSTFWH